ncbi:hypothetical protein PH586_14375 [Pseudomonas sp. SA3-5]|uniref:Uncharacterized protein n=1 Tax=Pseudomonas aestuarii TaxID=3018340 RepID=A0ABT4XHB9_9PSED|nr:hypothetical protein [Pseudomonas aestuarii]MDA7087572.1 hypothetical protein [Pseudomonas aestuarii]
MSKVLANGSSKPGSAAAGQVGDEQRRGERGDEHEAVELGFVGAPAEAFTTGEPGARIMDNLAAVVPDPSAASR